MSEETTKWWISVDGEPKGPFTVAEVQQKVAAGEINAANYACQVETDDWKRLSELSEFANGFKSSPALVATVLPSAPPDEPQKARLAWNPLALAWLGVLFWPAWTGVMAAINIRRLGLDRPLWRPLAIGIGSAVAQMLIGCAGFEMWPLVEEVVFVAIPLIALWHLELEHQTLWYANRQRPTHDHWIVPVLAGSPFALLTIVGWWFMLFGPLEATEVVTRFWYASSASVAKSCVTSNLYSLVDDMEEIEQIASQLPSDDTEFEFDLLTDYYLEGDNNQYTVEFRLYCPPEGTEPAHQMEGYFHLRWIDSKWKIDDILVVKVDGSESPYGPQPFASFIHDVLIEARREAADWPKQQEASFWLIDIFNGIKNEPIKSIRMAFLVFMVGGGLIRWLYKKLEAKGY